jgi:hypothetical protein
VFGGGGDWIFGVGIVVTDLHDGEFVGERLSHSVR